MKKHLTFKDDKSDKFWSIEVNGKSFTVTYGARTPESSEDFSTEEECMAEANKLIEEKINWGYAIEEFEFDNSLINLQKWFSGISGYITSFDKIYNVILSKSDYLSEHHKFYPPEKGEVEINANNFKDIFEQPESEVFLLSGYASSIVNSCIKSDRTIYEIEVPIEIGVGFALFFNKWIRKCISQEDIANLIDVNNNLPVKGHGIFEFLVIPIEIINRYDWTASMDRSNDIETELSVDYNLIWADQWDEGLSNLLAQAKLEMKENDKQSLFLTNNWISLLSKNVNDEDDLKFGVPGRVGIGTILHWVF